jgi:membrane-associated protease RseP (regulator of RpoE activity)
MIESGMPFIKTVCKNLTIVLVTGLILFTSNGYAFDFYGADVSDSDVPSVYFKVGLYGVRPIVNAVAFDSVAAKAGLQRGNVILSINGIDVEKTSELQQFTTNVLSVLILSGFEIKVVSVDRLAPETSKSRSIWNFKQFTDQSRLAKNVPADRIKSPSSIADIRLPEIDKKKPAPAEVTVPQISREMLTRNNPPAEVFSAGQLRKGKSEQASRETAEKVSRIETNRDADKSVPVPPLIPNQVTTKKDIFTIPIKPAYDVISFENSKGTVTFRHSIHLKSLSREQCLICHWTTNPTLESIKSRLNNNRTAHSLCRGCHQKMQSAPSTECHQCHRSGNK